MKYANLFFLIFFLLLSGAKVQAESQNPDFLTNQILLEKIPTDLKIKIANNVYPLEKTELEKWIQSTEELQYSKNYQSQVENINVCRQKKSILCSLVFPLTANYQIKKISSTSINIKALSAFADDLARQVDKDPSDAKLQVEDGKVTLFSVSGNGLALRKDESIALLLNYLNSGKYAESITLPIDEIKPSISSDSIDNMGITSLIGEGRSNFRGSPKNRIFNIKVATDRFNGVLIKPGEEFSFTKLLGEVDGEHGYLPELVIKKDKTEPEFGGGICQVSTTAFRAAIYSGLKITARKNHAYPVSYYNPQGMDATVYVPRPDLRFINNTPAYILIQTKIEGTELIFQFYGTDDGRKTEVIGPKITERGTDGSLKATFTQKVSTKDGTSLLEDVFNSNYDSPSKYPHPGQTLTQKPADWSDKQWKAYKKTNNL